MLAEKGNLHANVIKLKSELETVQAALDKDPHNSVLHDQEAMSLKDFNDALIEEERFLKQKAKIEWLRVGDSNSAYFHKVVKGRSVRNHISSIFDSSGKLVEGQDVYDAFVKHFSTFLGNSGGASSFNYQGLTSKTISQYHVDEMMREVTNEEVKSVMFSMGEGYLAVIVSTNQSAFIPGRSISDNFAWSLQKQKGFKTRRSFVSIPNTLVMEILTLILQHNVQQSDSFSLHHHCQELQAINLCFVDDLNIFMWSNVESTMVITNYLDELKAVSGLAPSLPKSTAYFCNVSNVVKQTILNVLPFEVGQLPVKYLRAPLVSSRLVLHDCKLLIEKVQKRFKRRNGTSPPTRALDDWPIFLSEWTSNVGLTKQDLSTVSVWVKLYDVPLVAYSKDGLSLIASTLGKPLLLDAYTSQMCLNSWGRHSYARALIELDASRDLKDTLVIAIPNVHGEGVSKVEVYVEYEWKPPHCSHCKVFGHALVTCPSQVKEAKPSK
uniref:uncharacterized protein LOC122585002 n=1 Tax=Erigeron canadensis TaxID=72917 RepID=UPI001CB93F24|nr:uncharacterized protein LOC122585002 [Erigeron canadensis]